MTRHRQQVFELTIEAVILLEKMALDKHQSMVSLIEDLIRKEHLELATTRKTGA
ncbi:MAG: hypothetical protein WC856_02605 [Methylococcaceae bacterium]|jgi:hypothetical protein